MQETEKLKDESVQPGKNGGARPGAGRPMGSENQATKERREALIQFKKRVEKRVDRLFNAQASLAEGIQYLFRIDEIKNSKGTVIKKEHVLVTDPEEIKAYLDGDYEKEVFYYISTQAPDNRAIDSLMDRTFGKAKETVEFKDERPITKVQVEIVYPDDGRTSNPEKEIDTSLPENIGSSEVGGNNT